MEETLGGGHKSTGSDEAETPGQEAAKSEQREDQYTPCAFEEADLTLKAQTFSASAGTRV